MKKLFLAFSLLFGAAVMVNAQDSTSTQAKDTTFTQDQATQEQDQAKEEQPTQESEQYRAEDMDENDKDRKEIAASELPETITSKLQGTEYSGWTVSKAYSKEKDGGTIYKVELKQGEEVKKIKFDAQGNIIKEKEKTDDDQK